MKERKKYPYQKGIPTPKYMPSMEEEPMAGPASKVDKATEGQKRAFQEDVITDLQAIETRLLNNFFRLNRGTTMEVEVLATPNWPKGIDTDVSQLVARNKLLKGVAGRRDLIDILSDPEHLSEYQCKLAKCLYDPRAPKQELKQIVDWAKEWEPTETYCSKNYTGGVSRRDNPFKAILPKAGQFSPEIQELEFGDIFTIFEGTQLEQIKLFLGRVCVGESGTIDPRTGEVLHHTYRNIMVVDGSYPGQGKSKLFNYLTDALAIAGYDVNKACPPLHGTFNLRAPFISDMIFRDDETSANLAKELSSPAAKIMATNGTVSTQEKGEQAELTKCTTAMLVLANRLDKKLFWGMDDGMRSRVTLCETVPEGAISDDKLPGNHLPALAEKLRCSIEAIMLWACRLATDEFLKYCNENSHKLEHRIKDLEASANKSNSDPLDGILSGIALGYLLETGNNQLPKYLNPDIIAFGLKGMLKLKQGLPGYRQLLDTLSNINGRLVIPGWHPVQGLVFSEPKSIRFAYQIAVNKSFSVTTNKHIEAILKAISLLDGNQCYGRSDVVIPRWTTMVSNQFTYQRILDLSSNITSYNKDLMVTDVDYKSDPFLNI